MKTKKRVIVAKIESTYNSDSTPAAANAILCSEPNINPLNAELIDRNLVQETLGASKQLHAGERVTVSFNVELAGAGAAGDVPAYGALLRACGLSETINAAVSVVYAPVSSSFESVTMYYFVDGSKHAITGMRGNVQFRFNSLGLPVMQFDLVGIYNAPSAVSNPDPVFTSFQEPLPVTKANTPTFTLDSYAAKLSDLSLNLGNQVSYENLVNQEEVTITDRQGNGSVSMWAPDLGTKDYFAFTKANSTGVLQLIHGTTAGNIVQVDCPAVQMLNPSYGDLNGTASLEANLGLIPSAGDDELTLTVK